MKEKSDLAWRFIEKKIDKSSKEYVTFPPPQTQLDIHRGGLDEFVREWYYRGIPSCDVSVDGDESEETCRQLIRETERLFRRNVPLSAIVAFLNINKVVVTIPGVCEWANRE